MKTFIVRLTWVVFVIEFLCMFVFLFVHFRLNCLVKTFFTKLFQNTVIESGIREFRMYQTQFLFK